MSVCFFQVEGSEWCNCQKKDSSIGAVETFIDSLSLQLLFNSCLRAFLCSCIATKNALKSRYSAMAWLVLGSSYLYFPSLAKNFCMKF